MGQGPHGPPGDAKHSPETREDALLTMRIESCMAGNSKFLLAERPEPRYTPEIALYASFP
jgi:hypothetical protein